VAVLDAGQRRGRPGTLCVMAVLTAAALLITVISPLRAVSTTSQPQAAQTARPLAFEVVSIRVSRSDDPRTSGLQYLPGGRFSAKGVPIPLLILEAYNTARLVPGPEFEKSVDVRTLERDRYDIEAVAQKGAIPPGAPAKDRDDKLRLMLQSLLVDRFKLVVHREKKEQPVYTIVVGKNGPKLQKAATGESACADQATNLGNPAASCHSFGGGQGQGLHGQGVDMSDLATILSRFADRPVLDKTGLSGLYNIQTVGWVPLVRPARPAVTDLQRAEDEALADPSRPTLFSVLDELGLKLESQTGSVETIVVDYVQRPTEN
jgi:uncharacterized protein (TIGR03435 family)